MASSSSTTTAQQQSNNAVFDNFTHMIIEDFLMSKKMHTTLSSFRSEYAPANESISILSWYEIAMKLHLPEIITQGSKDCTLLENLIYALLRESSVRSRRSQENTLNSLATQARPMILPTIQHDISETIKPENVVKKKTKINMSEDDYESDEDDDDFPTNFDNVKDVKKVNNNTSDSTKFKGSQSPKRVNHSSRKASSFVATDAVKKNIQTLTLERYGKVGKPSSENWVPEVTRLKSLERHIAVAKETLNDIMIREMTNNKDLKRLSVSDLDRARTEESLGSTKKIPCGCCLQKFLYVNLALVVTQKAVIDIRQKWGGLSSATVFTGHSIDDGSSSTTIINEDGTTTSLSSTAIDLIKKKNERSSTVPRCYDEIRVCVFCAQFFRVAEDYRPSFQSIVMDEKKQAHIEAKNLLAQRNDPLKMVQKDREIEEHLLSLRLELEKNDINRVDDDDIDIDEND